MKTIFEIYESILAEGSVKASMKYYPDFSEEELIRIASTDPDWNEKNPDRTGNFGRWLFDTSTRMKKNGEFSFDELDEVKRLLKLAKINKINIQKAKSFDELKNIVDGEKSSGKQFSTKKAAENYSVFKNAEKLGMRILLDDDEYVIGVPETFESSKVFGEDIGGRKISKWCTTTREMYDSYTNNGPLFIIMRKNDGNLYQIQIETNAMMDENDLEVNYFNIFQNDERIDLFQKYVDVYKEIRKKELLKKLLKNGKATREDGQIINTLGLTEIVIPDGVTNIGFGAFEYCTSLTSVTIPDSVTNIEGSTFADCVSLTSVTIPDSVTSIGDEVFANCKSLTSVTIPDSVTSIGVGAFYYCTSLTTITIPDSVISIGRLAFYNCDELKSLIFKGKTPKEVESMKNYPWGIENPEKVIKAELS